MGQIHKSWLLGALGVAGVLVRATGVAAVPRTAPLRYRAVRLPMEYAAALNQQGTVVGGDDLGSQLLLWKNGTVRVLAKAPFFKGTDEETTSLTPDTITWDERITGTYLSATDGATLEMFPLPFVWSKGKLQRGDFRTERAVNPRWGRVGAEDLGALLPEPAFGETRTVPATESENGRRYRHAVLYANVGGKGHRTDLGVLPGEKWSRAQKMNRKGQVIGQSGRRAFLWQNRTMTDLGVLLGAGESKAKALNARGQVVGTSGNRAFLWQENRLFDVNTLAVLPPHFVLKDAVAINDRGALVANGENTQTHTPQAFLLTPLAVPSQGPR